MLVRISTEFHFLFVPVALIEPKIKNKMSDHPKEDVHHSVKEAVEKHVHEHFPSHEKHAPHHPGDHSPNVISTHEAHHNEEFHTTPKGG
jgi:hypothetical protein